MMGLDTLHTCLSPSISAGSITGLVARGGFIVDIYWSGGTLTNATITSNLGGTLTLKVANGTTFSVNGETYINPIKTTAGGAYVLHLSSGTGKTSTTGTKATTSTTSTVIVTTTSTSPSSSTSTGLARHWGQCGGVEWAGPTQYVSPYTCQKQNPYYSQCL